MFIAQVSIAPRTTSLSAPDYSMYRQACCAPLPDIITNTTVKVIGTNINGELVLIVSVPESGVTAQYKLFFVTSYQVLVYEDGYIMYLVSVSEEHVITISTAVLGLRGEETVIYILDASKYLDIVWYDNHGYPKSTAVKKQAVSCVVSIKLLL